MAKKETTNSSTGDAKLFAFLATFLSIVGFIIALIAKKEDKYIMFYAKQSLVVFIVGVIAWVVMIIPVLGWVIGAIIQIFYVVLWVISWIYALSGEEKEVPLVGKYAQSIKL
jgi:uncharacterized membrane protein